MSQVVERSCETPSILPLATGIPAFLAAISGVVLIWQALRPMRVVLAGLAADRFSAVVGLFVALLGWVVVRFASRAMEGHPERPRLLSLVCFTVCMAFVVACAANALLLVAAWVMLGASVRLLLASGRMTLMGRRSARRKLVVATVGDLALAFGVGLLAWWCGSWDMSECIARAPGLPYGVNLVVTLLVAIAAMARSVQVPFHVWLPDTMDAPTPVSALLHAGVLNAGGLLLIRFAPMLVRAPEVCCTLSAVGTATIVLGTLSMTRQVRLKHALAWSTIAQMGFMTVQCALAAFPAALLHLIGHGSYKALAFLRSGERPPSPHRPTDVASSLSLLVLGSLSAVSVMMLLERFTGLSMAHSPGEAALALVVAIAVGQAWMTAGTSPWASGRTWISRVAVMLPVSLGLPLLCVALYRAVGHFLQPVLGDLPPQEGVLAWTAAVLPAAAIMLLAVSHAMQPWLERAAAWRSMEVQARAGFHLARMTDHVIDAALARRPATEVRHG